MSKYDRRRKYYLIVDTETATLPYAANFPEHEKKKIAIAKPLIYDLGWTVIDRKGNIYAKKQYVISEIFSVPAVFDTAYYKDKRPIYLEKLQKGEIVLADWNTAIADFLSDLECCVAIGAYNAMFDTKKAFPFTEAYIKHLYSPDFYDWQRRQEFSAEKIAKGEKPKKCDYFDGENFLFRDKKYPLFDIWALCCEHMLDNDEYRKMCFENQWETESGKYFKTSAETAYRFYTRNSEFIESHTALDDAIIEGELLSAIIKRDLKKFQLGLVYFPFRMVGKTEDYYYLR